MSRKNTSPRTTPTKAVQEPPAAAEDKPANCVSHGAIMREREVAAETGTSRTFRWRGRCDGTFPRPVKLGKNSIGYFRSEIERWLNERERV